MFLWRETIFNKNHIKVRLSYRGSPCLPPPLTIRFFGTQIDSVRATVEICPLAFNEDFYEQHCIHFLFHFQINETDSSFDEI